MKALLKVLRAFVDRLADWYWRDPIAAERHRVECDVRRLESRKEIRVSVPNVPTGVTVTLQVNLAITEP